MGEYEKHPLNIGIAVAENVIKGFDPDVFKDQNGAPLRICRNTAMARAAFDQTVQILTSLKETEEANQVIMMDGDVAPEEAVAPAMLAAEAPSAVESDQSAPDKPEENTGDPDEEDQPMRIALSQEQLQALFGGEDADPDINACFQIAMNLLSVNTPAGPETVFPNGHRGFVTSRKENSNNNSSSGTGQYL